MIVIILFLYPLYFSAGEWKGPGMPFGSENLFFNPALMGSKFNPGYSLTFWSGNLALTNNGISIALYNDVMGAEGDSINKTLKDKFLGYIGDKWEFNHISYFTPFSFSTRNFGFGLRLVSSQMIMFPEEWLRLVLYGNQLNEIYHMTNNNTGAEQLSYLEARAGGGGRLEVIPEQFSFLFGLSTAFLLASPYFELKDVDVYLGVDTAVTGYDRVTIRYSENLGYGFDITPGIGIEYRNNFIFGISLAHLFSSINFNEGTYTITHSGDLDTLFLGMEEYPDTVFSDYVDTTRENFSVRLPLILKLSGTYFNPDKSYSFYVTLEQGFENRALSTKKTRFSIGGEYFVHPRVPLRFGLVLGGYEGIGYSIGFGIISRGFSSINFGFSQYRGIWDRARGVSLSFLMEFHEPFYGRFKGKIIDSLTNKPIASAKIIIKDEKGRIVFESITDNFGEIQGKLKPGNYLYEVSAKRYYPKRNTFVVKAGKLTSFTEILRSKFALLVLHIKDKETEKPIGDVKVTLKIKDKEKEFKTDTTGILKMLLEEGEYIFRFEHPEYAVKTELIRLKSCEHKEKEVLLATKWGIVKGIVHDAKTNEPLAGSMEIYTEQEDSLILKIDVPASGAYETKLYEGIYMFKVNVEGYAPQAAYVSVKGGEKIIKDFAMVKKGMVFTFRNIYFDFNSSKLRPESYPVLDSIAQFLKENPTIIVEIGGHADSRGSRAYNKRLTQARANSVKTYLVTKHNINPARLVAVGYGEDRPVVFPERSEADYQMNRRVEFKILGERK